MVADPLLVQRCADCIDRGRYAPGLLRIGGGPMRAKCNAAVYRGCINKIFRLTVPHELAHEECTQEHQIADKQHNSSRFAKLPIRDCKY
jgi:hypothetical protein